MAAAMARQVYLEFTHYLFKKKIVVIDKALKVYTMTWYSI